ncbi:MAG: vitamin K epoxide reductase family protein [Actinomycetota bacterium]
MTHARRGQAGDGRPPGWSTNPSTWSQRLPIVVLALAGTAVAAYLSLFQLHVIDTVWEPFFGDGSRQILRESSFSRFWERLGLSDAALGAAGYLADAVTGVIGGTRRWRTMPWIVLVFGFFVGPFGVISIALVVIQPVLYSEFCTLCIASAVISLAMIGPAMDEILASLQYLRRQRTEGHSLWRTFWGLTGTGAT